jgi:hypothetical protein
MGTFALDAAFWVSLKVVTALSNTGLPAMPKHDNLLICAQIPHVKECLNQHAYPNY